MALEFGFSKLGIPGEYHIHQYYFTNGNVNPSFSCYLDESRVHKSHSIDLSAHASRGRESAVSLSHLQESDHRHHKIDPFSAQPFSPPALPRAAATAGQRLARPLLRGGLACGGRLALHARRRLSEVPRPRSAALLHPLPPAGRRVGRRALSLGRRGRRPPRLSRLSGRRERLAVASLPAVPQSRRHHSRLGSRAGREEQRAQRRGTERLALCRPRRRCAVASGESGGWTAVVTPVAAEEQQAASSGGK